MSVVMVRWTGLLVALAAAVAVAADEPGWLDARACGASGSAFETTAALTAGSSKITVTDPGDFQVGQGVALSRADVRTSGGVLWGPRAQYAASQPLKDAVEVRGYDGSQGSWLVYALDVEPVRPATFRWTDDLGRTWHPSAAITGDWQPLAGGLEVRFAKTIDWSAGYVATFSLRDQLVATIEAIDGHTLTLHDAPRRTAPEAVVRHSDQAALQAAVDQALQKSCNLLLPPGVYRLVRPVTVKGARGLTIAGFDGVHTTLDIAEGEGACLSLVDGAEVTLRNLRFVGHTGFAGRDQAGYLSTRGAQGVWGFYLKPCNAVGILNTERVLVENCHATKMSAECFYASGRARTSTTEPAQYEKSITYLRCSVVDSARNAFNNNNLAENTSVLQCRIVDVGGCSWEGASRFVRFIGNYVRNAGTVAMGNIRSRGADLEALGSGQHIVADNVFEAAVPYGGCAIRAADGATQVIIRNNLFVNFNGSAIELRGLNDPRSLTAANALISGNQLDLTALTPSVARTGIDVSASDVTVADNQIYVRGAADPQVTGIRLREPAVRLSVHGNQLRGCGTGLAAGRGAARVATVVDPLTFTLASGGIPFERRQSHRYRGWPLIALRGGKVAGTGVVDEFDPETEQYRLRAKVPLAVGDSVELHTPGGADWDLHDNTLTGCLTPVVLDAYGSATSRFAGNTLTRGEATGVKQALALSGRFALVGNTFDGFDEPGSAALALLPDRLGQPIANLVRDNLFARCGQPVTEAAPGLWAACQSLSNQVVDAAGAPAAGLADRLKPGAGTLPVTTLAAPPGPLHPTVAGLRGLKPTLDGAVAEWPADRWTPLARTPAGDAATPAGSFAVAADRESLWLAVRVQVPAGTKLTTGAEPYQADGLELSLQPPGAALRILWLPSEGPAAGVAAAGTSAEQAALLTRAATWRTHREATAWTGELRLPWSALGLTAAPPKVAANLGAFQRATETWTAWAGTGGALYEVAQAGEWVWP